jgi:hypothetical protein
MMNIPNMIMIGGNSRNAGKTSIACSIINKLSATHQVIGLKVTSIRPGDEGRHGNHKEEVTSGFSIFEEHDSELRKDTSKMLKAGATRVYYLRVEDTFIEEAILHFFSSYINNELVVCESRSLRNIIEPGLFLMMMREPAIGGPKDVSGYLEKADCIFNFISQKSDIQLFNNSLYFNERHFSFANKKITQ